MNKSKIVFLLLVAISTIIPALAMAESESDDEENEIGERESGENEREGEEIGRPDLSNTILYITLVAIASVVGYSAYKIYRARNKSTKKMA